MPFRVYLIGVQCSLDELQPREIARGDRYLGTAARQFDRVHRYGKYDFEVDASTTAADICAEQIQSYILANEPSAFRILRAST
jgi:chloramphenicol 3-O phosphotransferase